MDVQEVMQAMPEKWRKRTPPTEKHLEDLESSKKHLLGKKFVLWTTEYTDKAYVDQMQIPHKGYVVKEEIEVTIVELRLVPCMWTAHDWYTGWRAEDKDGNEYFNNWEVFPSDSMTPGYYWDGSSTGHKMHDLVDATQAFEHGGRISPYCTPEGERAVPTGYKVCEKHPGYLVRTDSKVGGYTNEDGESICFKCHLESLKSLNVS